MTHRIITQRFAAFPVTAELLAESLPERPLDFLIRQAIAHAQEHGFEHWEQGLRRLYNLHFVRTAQPVQPQPIPENHDFD